MSGTAGYRRRIELVTVSPEGVEGELEDDFHHFRVSIAHDGAKVTALEGTAVRHPWSTCPAALDPLRSLVGAPVTTDATAHRTHGDARTSCTHWFDLTGLAIAQAGSGRERRRYDMTVPDRGDGGRTTAHLSRDGEALLAWEVDTQTILGPAPVTGQSLGRGFLTWATRPSTRTPPRPSSPCAGPAGSASAASWTSTTTTPPTRSATAWRTPATASPPPSWRPPSA